MGAHPITAAEAPARNADYVQSLERGLAVIGALHDARRPVALSDVARATGLTRAAARRFLLTLVEIGYVGVDDGRYALRPRVLELGQAYLASLQLPEVALPHLERLVAAVQESSSVSVLDDTEIVYVARVPLRRIMSLTIEVGTRFPAFATSMGRVLLAGLAPDDRDDRLARSDLRPLTSRTVCDVPTLHRILDEVATEGFAVVDQELEEGLCSVAVPIRDSAGRVVAAMNVSTHADRTSPTTVRRRILPKMRAAVAGIEAEYAAAEPVGRQRSPAPGAP